jgi:phosphoribosylanthranilate isomerase
MRDESILGLMKNYDADAFLLDGYLRDKPGGTGQTFDWQLVARAKQLGRPIILSGGLTPRNARECIQTTQPDAVDVSSGVESTPGKKDHDKIRAFLEAAKGGH